MRPRGATMSFGNNMTDAEARELHDRIVAHGRAVVTGVTALARLKRAIQHAVENSGVVIEWDPSTPAVLRERMAIVSLSAARWAIPGAAGGVIASVFSNRPALCVLIGAGVGALLGAVQGHYAVQSGWRLRGYQDEQGVENVEVIVRALPKALAAGPTGQQQRRGDPWWQGNRPEDPRWPR